MWPGPAACHLNAEGRGQLVTFWSVHPLGLKKPAWGGQPPGHRYRGPGQRRRLTRLSLSRSATAPGSSSIGRVSTTPAASMASKTSSPFSVRTKVRVQSLKAPIPPVDMSACSAAKSGQVCSLPGPAVRLLQRELW